MPDWLLFRLCALLLPEMERGLDLGESDECI
jgi:hypothetical protein